MGITTLPIEVGNVASPDHTVKVLLVVDSGAIYSVIPRGILESLGIKPFARQSFTLANGESIERDKGGAVFKYSGRIGVADVVFGEKDDMALLGAFTLEALGLSLDPLRRELNPIPMLL